MRTPRTVNLKVLTAILLAGFILFNLIPISFAHDVSATAGQCPKDHVPKSYSGTTGAATLCEDSPSIVKEEAEKEIVKVKCPTGSTALYDDSGKFFNCVAPSKTGTCEKKALEYRDKEGRFVGCIVAATETTRAEDIKEITPIEIQAYETSVKIPCQPIAGGKCPEPTTLAGYIARLYQFGLMIAGLTAFGAIVFGALKYILSAGSMASQQDARDQITQAIIGLVLLLGAYLILYTINPDLVSLRNPSAEIIDIEKIIKEQEKDVFVGKKQELPTDEGEVPLIKNCKTAMKTQITVNGKQKVRIDCRKCIEGYERQEDEDGTTWCKAIGMD